MELSQRFINGLKQYNLTPKEVATWKYCGSIHMGRPLRPNDHLALYLQSHPEFKIPKLVENCVCEHDIKENWFITNGKITLIIGNCCVKKFTISGTKLQCSKCGVVIKRAVGINLCPACKKIKHCKICKVEFIGCKTTTCCKKCRKYQYEQKCELCNAKFTTGRRNIIRCENCKNLEKCKCGTYYDAAKYATCRDCYKKQQAPRIGSKSITVKKYAVYYEKNAIGCIQCGNYKIYTSLILEI